MTVSKDPWLFSGRMREPFNLALEFCNPQGVNQSLADKSVFLSAYYQSTGEDVVLPIEGVVALKNGKEYFVWNMDGSFLTTFVGMNEVVCLDLTLAEDGRQDTLINGTIQVGIGAPNIPDRPNAGIGQGMWLIRRLNDETTYTSPQYVLGTVTLLSPQNDDIPDNDSQQSDWSTLLSVVF